MHFDAEFFVFLGFIIFALMGFYMGAHTKVAEGLDARGKRIAADLADAQRLREEAARILEGYKAKRAEAEGEAAAIVAQAKVEAETLAREAETRMSDFVARRQKQAEQKIAMAEQQALADVRAAAADSAVRAAETVLRQNVRGDAAGELVTRGIADMKARLN